jgi:Core-2/I-Branching enzyme
MELAYIVSAYKLPEQLTRLVTRLSTPRSSFLIHVDRKTEQATYRRIVDSLSPLPNVQFLERHRCDYGGFGHVKATIKGIHELFRQRLPFDYVILLTGQDYPIKSNRQIADFFSGHDGRSFMEYFALPSEEWQHGGMDRIQSWHFRMRGRYLVFPPDSGFCIRRRFPLGLQPFGGSAYWCLSRECAEYIHLFLRSTPSYIRFFKYVNVPEEMFFQTIVLNSPLKGRVVNDDLRYLDWRNPAIAGGPAVLSKQDFGEIMTSHDLFARKFDMTHDAEILDMIDATVGDD